MAKKDSQLNLQAHSKAKVELLEAYLKRYLNIICNTPYVEKISVFDLFCGEGLYKNQGEGSPLVILNQIQRLHTINAAKLSKIPPIDCFFNDKSNTKTNRLKEVINRKFPNYSKYVSLKFTNIDYEKIVVRLTNYFSKLKNHKTFVFIDPYGYKNIKTSQIKELMQYKNAEVLLWLPTQFMYRFSKNGTPEALIDFIEELTPYQTWTPSDNVWKFVEQLKYGFQDYMGESFFVDKFAIRKDTRTVVCLFFFTAHIRGFEKMLEAKWEVAPDEGEVWENKGNTLFSSIKTNPLADKLKSFLKGAVRSNGDIYEFTLRQGYLPKDTNEIFKAWQNQGTLKVIATKNPTKKVRTGAFYNSYENYKKNPKKVYYRLLS